MRGRHPAVRIVALPENRGFAGGNNAGVAEARAPVVAFLNNDTVAEPGWLRALVGGLDRASGFALATSRIVYMHDPQMIDSAGDGLLRAGGAFKRLHGMPSAEAAEPLEVFGVCGAACLMPKSVFDELGGFDEDFFASHEDVDLSYRARLRGYRVRYVPDAIVRHQGSATLGRQSSRAVYYGQRNLEWVYLKNSPAWILFRTARRICLQRRRRRSLRPRGAGLAFIRAKGGAGRCRQRCGNAPPFSARAASPPVRSGACWSRGGSGSRCARSASIRTSRASRHDIRAGRRHRQLQRRSGAAPRARVD